MDEETTDEEDLRESTPITQTTNTQPSNTGETVGSHDGTAIVQETSSVVAENINSPHIHTMDGESENEEDDVRLELPQAPKKTIAETMPLAKDTSDSFPHYIRKFYGNFRKEINSNSLLAECKLCTEAAGTAVDIRATILATSNWLKHIKRRHEEEYDAFENSQGTNSETAAQSGQTHQSTIENHFAKQSNCGAAFSEELDHILTVMFTVDNCPLNLLTKVSFKKLLKVTFYSMIIG